MTCAKVHQIARTYHFGSCIRFRHVLGDYWFWSWLGYPLSCPGGFRVNRQNLQASRRTPSNFSSLSFFFLFRVSVSWSSHNIILAVWGRGNVVKRPLRSSWTAVLRYLPTKERERLQKGSSSVAGDLAWTVLSPPFILYFYSLSYSCPFSISLTLLQYFFSFRIPAPLICDIIFHFWC